MSTSLESNTLLSMVEDRAHMLCLVREFFKNLNIIEVDTPILSKYGCQDTFIDLMQTRISLKDIGYLHSSPEYGMKKLLCKIKKDMYQLCHVFRQNEIGKLHRPEFTMIEWYILDKTLEDLIEQTLKLIQLFIPSDGYDLLSYEDVFLHALSMNPFSSSVNDILTLSKENGFQTDDKEEALSFLWDIAEKSLGQTRPCVVIDFPGNDSFLAKTVRKNGRLYAKRFEVYMRGIELANGFDELLDPEEHRSRFEAISLERKALGKAHQVIDESFLKLLKLGLPSCVGVAVGFDRLMMLRHKTDDIEDILPLSWEET